MPDPIRLVVSHAKPVRACGTCRHYRREYPVFHCDAVDLSPMAARMYGWSCGPDGRFWEVRPPNPGLIERCRRFLFGERG